MKIIYQNRKYTDEEIEEKYKKGIISFDEYEKLVGDKLTTMIKAKVKNEFNNYKKKLLELPKELIIDKSYETTVKQEFIDELKYKDLYIDEKKALINRDNLLDEFYKDWLDTDAELYEAIDNSFDETVIYLTRYYMDQKKQKEKELDK